MTKGVATPDRELKRLLKELARCNGKQSEAASNLGVNRNAFLTLLATARLKFPELYTPPQPRTLSDAVAEHQSKTEAQTDRKRLHEAVKEIADLRAKLDSYEYAHNVSLQPADWTLDTRSHKGKSVHIPVLFFSDAQCGEVVRAEEIGTPWDYNTEIFRQRYRRMIEITVDLALNHKGERWSYPGIIYLRGGDNISGGLHEDLRELGEDVTPIQQCEVVAEEEARGIEIMADAFGRVEVKTPGSAGNHDRTTKIPPTKLAWARSYDRLVHQMLVNHFKRDRRVEFHITRSPDIRFPIFEKTNLLTHGDKIGSRGGMGFVGPGATILRGWQKVFMEQARLRQHVDMLWTGHFHWPIKTFNGIGNGSFTGTTEYGKTFRGDPIAPMQYLTFWHRRGLVDTREIYLAD